MIASPVVVATAAQIARRVRERTRSSEYRYADRRVAARKAPEIPRPSQARPAVRIAGTDNNLFRIILPFRLFQSLSFSISLCSLKRNPYFVTSVFGRPLRIALHKWDQ